MHPATAAAQGLADGDWVILETPGVTGSARLRLKLTDTTPEPVVSTGMGWWLPEEPAPDHGVLDVNINAALSYSGPYDPVTGSSSIRGQRARVTRAPDTANARRTDGWPDAAE